MAQTQTSNASNTLAVVLGTNQIVERCFAKMAHDVTSQVRDKLIDIILAVVARECVDVDVELLRRVINAEIPDPTITIEKRVKTQDPDSKPTKPKSKTVELDADGNPIKRARKEKAPKAPKEPKAPKAVLSEEEKAALKAEKEAVKAVAKEAAKAAKQLEREAAKAAKALADAEKPAKPAKEPKAPKEVRLPIPWCGVAIPDRCQALRSYHGLFAQCTADNTEICAMCPSCEKAGAPFGTVAMRKACGVFDYTAPNGKKCVRLANVIEKFGLADAGEQAFQEEAARLDITIPHEHFEKEVKQRGRPKSLSPRATTKGKGKGKVATTDTTPASSRTASDNDNSEAEDDEIHTGGGGAAAVVVPSTEKKAKQQQARKKVVKTTEAAAADAAESPKKRGRPAKAKEPVVEVNESLIQDLVSSASGRADATPAATPKAATPAATPKAASPATASAAAAAAPKKQKPAAATTSKITKAKKPAARATEEVEGAGTYWVESYDGHKVYVHPESLVAYDASTLSGVGMWDDVAKTIIFEDEEEEGETEIQAFSEDEGEE
jgi:hypothetical protein